MKKVMILILVLIYVRCEVKKEHKMDRLMVDVNIIFFTNLIIEP